MEVCQNYTLRVFSLFSEEDSFKFPRQRFKGSNFLNIKQTVMNFTIIRWFEVTSLKSLTWVILLLNIPKNLFRGIQLSSINVKLTWDTVSTWCGGIQENIRWWLHSHFNGVCGKLHLIYAYRENVFLDAKNENKYVLKHVAKQMYFLHILLSQTHW